MSKAKPIKRSPSPVLYENDKEQLVQPLHRFARKTERRKEDLEMTKSAQEGWQKTQIILGPSGDGTKTMKTQAQKNYAAKRLDPRWQRRRLEIMHRDNFLCQICGDGTTTLNVHHLNGYRKGAEPWEYSDDELETLCEHCHLEQHKPFVAKRFYFAGKVSKNCWRGKIVKGLRAVGKDDGDYRSLCLEKSILSRHHYCGPFFISCDHGCSHSKNQHGMGMSHCTSASDYVPTGQREAQRNCLSNIRNCDVFFAWIDSMDCYGTIAEIGFASALGKQIVIATTSGLFEDMWFPLGMASHPFLRIWAMSPVGAFRKYIQLTEAKANRALRKAIKL